MLNHLDSPTLQERRQSSRIKFMEKIINKSVAIPEAYLPDISYTGLTRATKRDASKGELPYLSTNQGHTLRYSSSFMPRTVRDWNLLPKGTGFSLGDYYRRRKCGSSPLAETTIHVTSPQAERTSGVDSFSVLRDSGSPEEQLQLQGTR